MPGDEHTPEDRHTHAGSESCYLFSLEDTRREPVFGRRQDARPEPVFRKTRRTPEAGYLGIFAPITLFFLPGGSFFFPTSGRLLNCTGTYVDQPKSQKVSCDRFALVLRWTQKAKAAAGNTQQSHGHGTEDEKHHLVHAFFSPRSLSESCGRHTWYHPIRK